MRVILCRELGSPDVLTVEERPDPEPGMGEVLVRQEAWGVNYVDALMVAGGYQLRPDLPFVPGLEAAGTVVATGWGSNAFEPGDRVVVSHRPGGFAELAVATFDRVRPAPPELDMPEAAVFRSAYHTALHALLQRGRLAPGETVLVLGAAGGVGMAAVHCAKRLGAQVIAAAAGEEKLAALRRQGADVVIDYRAGFRSAVLAATGGRGADVVYDPVGGDAFDEAMRSTAWGGRILSIGFASGRWPVAKVNHILIKGHRGDRRARGRGGPAESEPAGRNLALPRPLGGGGRAAPACQPPHSVLPRGRGAAIGARSQGHWKGGAGARRLNRLAAAGETPEICPAMRRDRERRAPR